MSHGPCSYCSLVPCPTCLSTGQLCHFHPVGRTICPLHARDSKVVLVPTTRVLVVLDSLTEWAARLVEERMQIVKREFESLGLFSSFYNALGGVAHYFEIFDSKDLITWKAQLPYSGIYVFFNEELAREANQICPELVMAQDADTQDSVAVHRDGYCRFHLCSQCNIYQAAFPFHREVALNTLPQQFLSKSYGPNFYSESLCRKPNNSHDKKKKGGRKKFGEDAALNIPESFTGVSPLLKKQKITHQHCETIPEENNPNLNINLMNSCSSASSQMDFKMGSLCNFASVLLPEDHDRSSISQVPIMLPSIKLEIDPRFENYGSVVEPAISSVQIEAVAKDHTPCFPADTFSIFMPTNEVFASLKNSANIVKSRSNLDDVEVQHEFLSLKLVQLPEVPILSDVSISKTSFFNEVESLHNLGQTNVSNISNVQVDGSGHFVKMPQLIEILAESAFKDSVALILLENRNFSFFRNYLSSFPIDPIQEPLRFVRYELQKLLSFYSQLNHIEALYVAPALPTLVGEIIEPSDLFYFNKSKYSHIENSELDMLIQFDCVWPENELNENFLSTRQDLVSGLVACNLDLSFLLLDSNTFISKSEPILRIIFKFFNVLIFSVDNFNFLDVAKSYSETISNVCGFILNTYQFYLDYTLKPNPCPKIIYFLKTVILISFLTIAMITTRVRMLDIRSRVTINALQDCRDNTSSFDPALREQGSSEWTKRVWKYCDAGSLNKYCMPDETSWFDLSIFFAYMLSNSLNVTYLFSIDVNTPNAYCLCSILGKSCEHVANEKFVDHPVIFSTNYIIICVFVGMAHDVMEDIFSRQYCNFIKNMRCIKHSLRIEEVHFKVEVADLPIANLFLSVNKDAEDVLRPFRTAAFSSSFFNKCVMLDSGHDDPLSFPSLSPENIASFEFSLPKVKERLFFSSEATIDEAILYFKLALRVAQLSNDASNITYAGIRLVICLFLWKRDYCAGIIEAEKLIRYSYDALIHFPPMLGNSSGRLSCQSVIVRLKSFILQYQKHIAAGITNPFYPAQLVHLIIEGVKTEALYITLEGGVKPLYLSYLENCGGDAWAMLGTDLSLKESWRSLALDNMHLQFGSFSQCFTNYRVILHSCRIGEYSFERFKNDVILREHYSSDANLKDYDD